jgi:putative ABC transport system ATP-binding protein
VLDRVGRLQLPEEYLTTLGLKDRVRLELERTHVEIHPDAGVDAGTNTEDDK